MSIAREGTYPTGAGFNGAARRPSVAEAVLPALIFPLTLCLMSIALVGHWLRIWR